MNKTCYLKKIGLIDKCFPNACNVNVDHSVRGGFEFDMANVILEIFTIFTGPPDPPQNCDVHNHTTQGLSVTCSVGFGGGLEQTFHMEVRDRDSGYLLQNLSDVQPIFTVG